MSSFTRRDFMKTTALSAAALAMGTTGSRMAEAASSPYGDLRVGLQSYSLRHFSFEDALAKSAELGLHYIELFSGHLDHGKVTMSQLSDAKKLMADYGIQPDAYGVTGFDTDAVAARRIFDFAQFLGLRSISASPSKDSFDMLDKLVEEYQIPIAIHNHGPHDKWGRPEVILEAIKDHHELIGVCCDTGHFLRADVDPVAAVKMLRGRVYGLHVKDFVSEDKEAIAGDGKLDLAGLFAETRRQNFDGACSIEYELDPEDPMDGIRKGLSNIRQALAELG